MRLKPPLQNVFSGSRHHHALPGESNKRPNRRSEGALVYVPIATRQTCDQGRTIALQVTGRSPLKEVLNTPAGLVCNHHLLKTGFNVHDWFMTERRARQGRLNDCSDGSSNAFSGARTQKAHRERWAKRRILRRILVGCEWLEHSTYGLRVRGALPARRALA